LAHDRARGVALARDLLDEAAAAPYGEPAAAADDGNRLSFTIVGHYHGWSASPPVAPDGSPIASGAWRREIQVRQVGLDGTTAAAGATGLLRITALVYKGDRLVAR